MNYWEIDPLLWRSVYDFFIFEIYEDRKYQYLGLEKDMVVKIVLDDNAKYATEQFFYEMLGLPNEN